jgi:DNA-binding NtrC family response regulator
LQSKVITPVGGSREVKLNVRIIAATHRDLDAMVLAGSFREDLLHRLRVLTIEMPSLKEQATDFDRIVHEIIYDLSKFYQKPIHQLCESVAQIFEGYSWPGNYRELKNVLEFAVLSAHGNRIGIEDLPGWFLRAIAGKVSQPVRGEILKLAEIPLTMNYAESAVRFDHVYITHALLRYGGRINLTARKIGINKSTLMRKIKRLKIDRSLLGAGG